MLKGSYGFSLSVIRSLVIIVLSLSAVRVLPPVEEECRWERLPAVEKAVGIVIHV